MSVLQSLYVPASTLIPTANILKLTTHGILGIAQAKILTKFYFRMFSIVFIVVQFLQAGFV